MITSAYHSTSVQQVRAFAKSLALALSHMRKKVLADEKARSGGFASGLRRYRSCTSSIITYRLSTPTEYSPERKRKEEVGDDGRTAFCLSVNRDLKGQTENIAGSSQYNFRSLSFQPNTAGKSLLLGFAYSIMSCSTILADIFTSAAVDMLIRVLDMFLVIHPTYCAEVCCHFSLPHSAHHILRATSYTWTLTE